MFEVLRVSGHSQPSGRRGELVFTVMKQVVHEAELWPRYIREMALSSANETTDRAPARSYVVAWRLAGKKVVVVGAGSIGSAKIETLLPARANLIAIDPRPTRRVEELAEQGTVELRRRRVCPLDLIGAAYVVIATGDHDANARIARWARRVGAIVNAVDDPTLCDVTVPAVIERGPATIAITTNGTTPAGARFLRERISDFVDPNFGVVLDHARNARNELRRTGAYRYDYAAWRDRFFGPAWDAARFDSSTNIENVRRDFVDGFTHHVPGAPGRITLVGAGPGEADLITVRGARAIGQADVVLYDRLAAPELLDLAPRAAERIPVGKGKGYGMSQAHIEELLVSHASSGSHVVRLKGGDSFVFGRGCEEVDAARAHGIAVEVIPGLTSALVAPTCGGISVTDRRLSSGFTVISGHRATTDSYDWEALASLDMTLVVLMASDNAASVAFRLLEAGMDGQVGVAFVHSAGRADEQTAFRSLDEVAVSGCPFGSPTVMTIGAVVPAASAMSPELGLDQELARRLT